MNNLTAKLNEQNVEGVRRLIARKNSSQPYLANGNAITNTVTDMDHHPYTRWFRGVYYYPDPIVIEREAGWRPLHNNCYKVISPAVDDPEPEHCYEAACSTIFPCYPKYLAKHTDKDNLDLMINNACIVQYR